MAQYMCAGEKAPKQRVWSFLKSPHVPFCQLCGLVEGVDSIPSDLRLQIKVLPILYCPLLSSPSCPDIFVSPQVTLNAHTTPLHPRNPPHSQSLPSLPPLVLWCHSSCYAVSAPGLVALDLLLSTSHFPNLPSGYGKGLLTLFYPLPSPMSEMVTYTWPDFMILLTD